MVAVEIYTANCFFTFIGGLLIFFTFQHITLSSDIIHQRLKQRGMFSSLKIRLNQSSKLERQEAQQQADREEIWRSTLRSATWLGFLPESIRKATEKAPVKYSIQQ